MNTYQRMREENEQALKTMAEIEKILKREPVNAVAALFLIEKEIEIFWAAYGRLNCPRSKDGETK